ncbi:hypothetical protein M0R45_024241 [Rubus argutus]|uniref:Uncharacterized protein n=1 Tax=Rubus argutus TaxID=59490 RepID=A0AAW1WSK8_RUBAR
MASPRLRLISRRVVVVALFCAMAIHYAEAAKLAPPPAPCSNGTNNFTQEYYITRGNLIDQAIACVLMLLALVLTYLTHGSMLQIFPIK